MVREPLDHPLALVGERERRALLRRGRRRHPSDALGNRTHGPVVDRLGAVRDKERLVHERRGDATEDGTDPVHGLPLEDAARDLGATEGRLDTNVEFGTALAMFRAHGWREVEPYNRNAYATHWFAKSL